MSTCGRVRENGRREPGGGHHAIRRCGEAARRQRRLRWCVPASGHADPARILTTVPDRDKHPSAREKNLSPVVFSVISGRNRPDSPERSNPAAQRSTSPCRLVCLRLCAVARVPPCLFCLYFLRRTGHLQEQACYSHTSMLTCDVLLRFKWTPVFRPLVSLLTIQIACGDAALSAASSSSSADGTNTFTV